MGVSSVITSSVDGTESTRSRPSHSHTVLSDGGLLKLRRRLPLLLVRPLAARPLFGLAGWLCDAESIPKGTRGECIAVFSIKMLSSQLMRNPLVHLSSKNKSSQGKADAGLAEWELEMLTHPRPARCHAQPLPPSRMAPMAMADWGMAAAVCSADGCTR